MANIIVSTDIADFMDSSDKSAARIALGVQPTASPTFTGTVTADKLVAYGAGGVTSNTAIGLGSLALNTTGTSNTAIGRDALYYNIVGNYNTATGQGALGNNTGNYGSAFGFNALINNTTGINNVGLGVNALFANTYGGNNTAVGTNSLVGNVSGDNNTCIGFGSCLTNATGAENVSVGAFTLYGNTGTGNTAIGNSTLSDNTTGTYNTGLGHLAMAGVTTETNCTGLGKSATVTGSNQVQLGNSATTTYAYGAVQNRSDVRDKADIKDTVLGLDFVNALRPVDYKWDMRESYRIDPPAPVNNPIKPVLPVAPAPDASDAEKSRHEQNLDEYESRLAEYTADLPAYEAYVIEKDAWLEANKLSNITHDGTHKRSRFHHGLIAQEVQALIAETGIDFGGFQNHSVKGGDDVLSIGYEELIGPMIKAIQQLSAKVAELENPTS